MRTSGAAQDLLAVLRRTELIVAIVQQALARTPS
jgi:hypothetical protein